MNYKTKQIKNKKNLDRLQKALKQKPPFQTSSTTTTTNLFSMNFFNYHKKKIIWVFSWGKKRRRGRERQKNIKIVVGRVDK